MELSGAGNAAHWARRSRMMIIDHDQLDDGHDDDYDDGWMDKRDKYLFGNRKESQRHSFSVVE